MLALYLEIFHWCPTPRKGLRTHANFYTVASFAAYNDISKDSDFNVAKSYDHFLPLTYSNSQQHSTLTIPSLLKSIISLSFGHGTLDCSPSPTPFS